MRTFSIYLCDLSESANKKLVLLDIIPENSWVYGIHSVEVYYYNIPMEWIKNNEENKMDYYEFYDKVKNMLEGWLAR